MAKEVHLLDYWIPLLREQKEFKEIAKTEEIELTYLLEAIDRTLNNMFIETADEYGIERYEAMMGIYPTEGATLEERRFEVMLKWNDKLPYTEETLRNSLDVLCGEDGYKLNIDYPNYKLVVKLDVSSQHSFGAVQSLLDRIVPVNMVTEIALFNTHLLLSQYTHEQLGNYTYKEVREENLS